MNYDKEVERKNKTIMLWSWDIKDRVTLKRKKWRVFVIMNFTLFSLFFIVSVLNVVFSQKNIGKGILYTKPLLMPALILFYLLSSSNPDYFVILALAAGFLGDVLLIWSKKDSFLLGGIAAFLVGHLFYIIVFLRNSVLIKDTPAWIYVCLLLYIWAAILLFKLLFPHIKSMRIPAMLYMLIIFAMSFVSFSRITAVPFLSFSLVFLGSILFIVSDSVLAYGMFSDYKKNTGHYVMATYISAQLLIVIGFLAV